jgi:hypothetical protein
VRCSHGTYHGAFPVLGRELVFDYVFDAHGRGVRVAEWER